MCMCIHVYIYIYVYVYIHTYPWTGDRADPPWTQCHVPRNPAMTTVNPQTKDLDFRGLDLGIRLGPWLTGFRHQLRSLGAKI